MTQLAVIIVSLFFSLTFILAFVFLVPMIFEGGLLDFLQTGFEGLTYVLGGFGTFILVAGLCISAGIGIARLIMSFLGGDPGRSANH